MTDGLLDTVEQALALHDEAHHRLVCECVLCDPNTELRGWVRSLLARCREAEAEVKRLRERLTKSCIIEIAVDNPSVSDWMNHWEGRCLKAEADLAALRASHAQAVEASFREGWSECCQSKMGDPIQFCDEAWQASAAKARLT